VDPESKFLLIIDVGPRTLAIAQCVVHQLVQMTHDLDRKLVARTVVLAQARGKSGAFMDHLMALFRDIDDFCKACAPVYSRRLLYVGQRQRARPTALTLREILTLLFSFHWSQYRTFKHDYTEYVTVHLHSYCPQLVSYQRFVALLPRALVPLCCYLSTRKGHRTGMAFIDATPLAVCDHHRIATHKVFTGLARRGKTSMGWFFGFKRPLIVNDEGALLAFRLTPGKVDDRQPVVKLAAGLEGQLFGDRGYISQALPDVLLGLCLELLTKMRRNMKHRVMHLWDKLLLRKHTLIETIHDQLKNIRQIEHTRHRSVTGFMVNLIAGLVAYSYRPKKPSLGIRRGLLLPMLVV